MEGSSLRCRYAVEGLCLSEDLARIYVSPGFDFLVLFPDPLEQGFSVVFDGECAIMEQRKGFGCCHLPAWS